MKTYGSHIEGDGGKFVYDRIVTIKRYVRLEEAGADIIVMTEKLTDQQIAKWFQSIDMYVSFSRGEGFALPVVQAMASEVVVAHTGWGGPSDYMEDSKSGLLLPYTMQPVAGMPHNPWYRGNQWWAQVDIFKATEIIKKHMDGSGPVNGKAAREAVVKNCSIPAIAARIAERFAQLYNDGYIKV
jgi:glycosyltransferase involved in cell wall biosynthesis